MEWHFGACQFDDGALGMRGRDDKWLGMTAGVSCAEVDPAVLTRYLRHHIVLFSEAPVRTSVTFTDTQGRPLREVPTGHGYSQP